MDGRAFVGTFKLVSSENFDAFMKEVGVDFASRVLANQVKPEMTISISPEGIWTVTSINPIKSIRKNFVLNKEFTDKTPDGRQVRVLVKLENPTRSVTTEINITTNKISTVVREIVDDKLCTVCTCNSVVAARDYKRIS